MNIALFMHHKYVQNGIFWQNRKIISSKLFPSFKYSFILCKSSNNVSTFKVLFFGTDDFALSNLKALHEASYLIKQLNVVTIKTQKLIPAVKRYCHVHQIPLEEWPLTTLTKNFDIGIVVSFGKMIPEDIIKSFPLGMINVHPSILPCWRGAAPIPHTILNGDISTGVTICTVEPKKFDNGKILLQEHIPVPYKTTTSELKQTLSSVAAELLLRCLKRFSYYKNLSVTQNEQFSTKEMAKLEWSSLSTCHFYRMYRALNEFYHLHCKWETFNIKIVDIVNEDDMNKIDLQPIQKENEKLLSGGCIYHKKRKILCIKCIDGWIGVKKLIILNKHPKLHTAEQFYNGFLTKKSLNERIFH